MMDDKGCFSCGKGHAVLQMQNSPPAWRELPYRQPTSEYSGFSLTEHCDPAQENLLSEHSVPSGEMNPSDIAMEKKVVWSVCGGKRFCRVFLGGEI